jgi:hypothetical protein
MEPARRKPFGYSISDLLAYPPHSVERDPILA